MELVSAAIVQETVGQILSGLVQKYEEKEESNEKRNLERLEMAHIRLEAALETSNKWQITDASLLHWRRKLKRAAQECDDTLHKCKQRILEDEQMEWEVKNSSLPNRIVHATKSFALSIFKRNDNDLRRSIAQRFEWYADGASEFLRFIELGGTPRCHMPFDSLVKNLFAGKQLHHKIVRGNEYPSFQLFLTPMHNPVHGIDVSLIFIQYDGTPEGNISFSLTVQLSESIDIVGIAVKCLQLFASHFKCKFENIRNELTELPNEDFSWRPSIYLDDKQRHWDKAKSLLSQLARPNPFGCKEHGRHEVRHFSNMDMAGLSDGLLEPVIQFTLHCHVSLPMYRKQKTSLSEDLISLQDYPYLKAGITISPHGSLEDMLPANRSSEIAAIVRKEQHFLHTDISLEQLEEIMLPKAIDYFRQNAKAMVYQMLWKSKHGFALIQVEKPCMSTWRPSMRRRSTSGGARKRKLFQGDVEEIIRSRIRHCHWLDSWFTHVPVQLQRSLRNWIRKEKEIVDHAQTT
uniref:Rx N-terminal domain-containing protein n=1 Tax=Setaria italica TaxID=4555 RepID=K4A087_SETIT